ncbi:MAG: AI-2E family transporter [Elusimicrobiota bacterium]
MERKTGILNEKKFSKYFLLVTFILFLIVFLYMIRVFILPIILAVVIATLVYPLFKIILKLTKNRRTLASLLSCLIILMVILLPLIFIFNLVIVQSVEFYRTSGHEIEGIIQKGSTGIIGEITNSFIGKHLSAYNITIDWKSIIEKILNFFNSAIIKYINMSSVATAGVIFDLFIIMFSLFYFLRDGERMLTKIKDIIPLSDEYKDRIISRFYSMTNITVKGILFIAFLQSVLATLTLWVFGVKAWLLWGIVILIFSAIPFVGTGAVLIPAGIIKIISGDIGQGIAIMIISVFFISLIDNVLRPRIIGQSAGMHDLLVFFSIIGGIVSFGPAGLIIGPLIAAIFLTILEIYKIEFRSQIEHSNFTKEVTIE